MTSQNTITESKSTGSFEYMKRVALSVPGKLLLALAVVASLVIIPQWTKADNQNDADRNERHGLTGNWMVTVTRVNPPPGLAPTFLSLMTYFGDGNFMDESNTTAIRSTSRGSWERTGRHQFARSFTFFRFDAARNYLGTGVATATVTLSRDGASFQAEAQIQNFDPSGVLLATLFATEAGQRL